MVGLDQLGKRSLCMGYANGNQYIDSVITAIAVGRHHCSRHSVNQHVSKRKRVTERTQPPVRIQSCDSELLLLRSLLRGLLGCSLSCWLLRCCLLSHESRPSKRLCGVLSRLPGACDRRGRSTVGLNWSTLTNSSEPN